MPSVLNDVITHVPADAHVQHCAYPRIMILLILLVNAHVSATLRYTMLLLFYLFLGGTDRRQYLCISQQHVCVSNLIHQLTPSYHTGMSFAGLLISLPKMHAFYACINVIRSARVL